MKQLLTVVVIFISLSTFSQKSEFLQNTRFGGGFSFSFGNNNTTLAITPAAVYNFNKEISLGVSVGYLHNKQNDFTSNVFSVGSLALYKPIREIEFSAVVRQMFVNRTFGSVKDEYSYPSLNLGVAYVTGRVSLGVQFDVLHDDVKSINATAFTPIIRVFF